MDKELTRRHFVKGGLAVIGISALGGVGYAAATWGPEVRSDMIRKTIGDGMSKVLVTYGTKTGCTAGVAEQIGETLAKLGATVDVVPASDAPDPVEYDAVVVGSGIRVGSWHAAAKEWVQKNSEVLSELPTAFFTACLTIVTDPEKLDEVIAYTDPLIEETGVQPVELGIFKGWNEPKRFSLPERLVLKALKAPQGDFRENEKIASWTEEVAPKLGVVA